MIIPLAGREQWQPLYMAALSWLPRDAETVCIVPHPDDESLAVGGLISTLVSNGSKVRVVAVTDGENAYGHEPDLRTIRIGEQECSLRSLGVGPADTLRLELPDSNVAAYENQLIESVRPHITSKTLLLAPWSADFHPDHEACGRAANKLADLVGTRLIFYFFWTWHRGTPSILRKLPLLRFELSLNAQITKEKAIQCHRSQLFHVSGEPILTDALLWPARQPFEIFLAK